MNLEVDELLRNGGLVGKRRILGEHFNVLLSKCTI